MLGKNLNNIERALREIADRNRIELRGFHNASDEEIETLSGLSGDDLIRARQREYSIPLFYDEGIADILEREIARYNLRILYGGRFMHLLGQADKGLAVKRIIDIYTQTRPESRYCTIGLGDSLNDFDMLRVVDYPVLVKKHDGSYEQRQPLPGVIFSPDIGPAGWNQSVLQILNSGGRNE